MATEPQIKSLYFPAWNRVCRALNWRMVKGRLSGKKEPLWGGMETSRLYQEVWAEAEILARHLARAITAEDLRHACHVVAIGRDVSSKDLNNPALDRVLILFRLLRDPDDLEAMMTWLHPEHAERRRLIWSISNAAPDAYILRCATPWRGSFEGDRWDGLPTAALRKLLALLRLRGREWNSSVAEPEPAPEIPEGDPF